MNMITTPILILLFLFVAIFLVKQQSAAIIERFGKFNSVRGPGIQFKIPFVTEYPEGLVENFTT